MNEYRVSILMKDHAHLARSIALGFKRRLPAHIMYDDLHAAAMSGLWDAARLHPDCENFGAYARIRIRGAIKDDLRTKDWMPRHHRMRAKGDPDKAVHVLVDSGHRSLEDAMSGDDVEARTAAALALSKVWELVDLLPWRERHIFVSHHVHGVDYRSIAAELGVSEPRISQIHARTISRLREALAEDFVL